MTVERQSIFSATAVNLESGQGHTWSMQKRPAKKKLPRDVNARAFAIGELATSGAAPEPETADDGKWPTP